MTTGSRTKKYPNIIIVGKMQAGKTTAADYLVKNYGYTRVSLADPIKDIINSLDSLKNDKIISTFIKPYYRLSKEKKIVFSRILDATRALPKELPKPRKRLQFLGTDGVRNNIDSTFWLKILSRKVEGKRRIVIDDCRFLNEYDYFTSIGYENIKVNVSDHTQEQRLHLLHGGAFDPNILRHPSELDQEIIFSKYPDNIIQNDGGLKEYYKELDKWILKAK